MADSINPRMLTVARESRGFTQTGLAGEIGVTQSTYSRFESGDAKISDGDLRTLCGILDYPESFFYQPDVVWGFASPVFYHRKSARLSVGDLRVIQARLNVLRFHVTRLLPGVEMDHVVDVPSYEISENGSPARIAEMVRVAWKLPMGPIDDVVGILESAGIIIKYVDFGTTRIDAVVQVAPDAPPVIMVNRFAPGDRLRFTLAHELGHLVMHNRPSIDMEEEAHQFAAEFLLPGRELRPILRGIQLEKLPDFKLHWKVSMAALVKRAVVLESISERQGRSLFMRLSSNGWRINEPCAIESEKPHTINDLLAVYRNEYGYTLPELARLVNATERSFAADYAKDDDFKEPRLLIAE